MEQWPNMYKNFVQDENVMRRFQFATTILPKVHHASWFLWHDRSWLVSLQQDGHEGRPFLEELLCFGLIILSCPGQLPCCLNGLTQRLGSAAWAVGWGGDAGDRGQGSEAWRPDGQAPWRKLAALVERLVMFKLGWIWAYPATSFHHGKRSECKLQEV